MFAHKQCINVFFSYSRSVFGVAYHANIVVCTPGRLVDHLDSEWTVKYLRWVTQENVVDRSKNKVFTFSFNNVLKPIWNNRASQIDKKSLLFEEFYCCHLLNLV